MIYTCVASNAAGRAEQSALLTVNEAPSIVQLNDVTLVTGRMAQLLCRVRAKPPAMITWTAPSGIATAFTTTTEQDASNSLMQVGTLSFTGTNVPADAGPYTCSAMNSVNSVTRTASLIVLGLTIAPVSLIITEGSNATSVCNVTTGQITSNVTWTFNLNPLPDSQVFQSGKYGEIITYVNVARPTMIPGAPILHQCSVMDDNGGVLATSNTQSISVDVNNCLNGNYCEVVRGIPNSACRNVLGSPIESCLCLVGFDPVGACGNLDECSLGTHNCSALGGNCTDTFGSYQCACLAGFSGDGFNCVDIDECALPSPCHINATCNNTVGSFTCTCNPGYTGTGFLCGDLNECLVGEGPCDTNAMCANTVGSFTCTCNSGFTGTGLVCNDVNECLVVPGPCNANATCNNTIGSFTCTCNPGFNGTGFVCEDLNECLVGAGPCDANARCNNTIGSFTCTCIAGYTGNGFVCNDVNECLIGPGPCNANATCNNTIGSFTCTCNASFNGNGIICEDVNECMLEPGPCAPNATCTNVVGSFSCMCNPGFTGDGLTCVNIVECDNMPCDVNARCTDTVGSFACRCNPGFSGAGVGSNSCVDIDECSDGTHNCSAVSGTCTNVMGSFSCACAMGFSGNGLQCADVDECSSGIHGCSEFASCTNTVGSFICACLSGYTGTGQMCADTDECLQSPPACPSTNQLCQNMAGTFRCDCESGFYANDSSNCITVSNLLEGFVPPVAPTPNTLTWTITRFPDTSLINYRIVVVDLGTDPSTVDFSESPGFTYANGANVLTYEQVRDQGTFSTPRAAYYAAVFTFGSGQTMQFTSGADMMTTVSGVRNGPLVSDRSYTIFYEASAAAFTSRRKRQTIISGITASAYQPVQRTDAALEILELNNVSIYTDQRGRLECRVRGKPLPTILWSTPASANSNRFQILTLTVPEDPLVLISVITFTVINVLEDAGAYTCTANNAVSVSMATAYLTVLEQEASSSRTTTAIIAAAIGFVVGLLLLGGLVVIYMVHRRRTARTVTVMENNGIIPQTLLENRMTKNEAYVLTPTRADTNQGPLYESMRLS
ncbi:fibropellin-1-like isoform X2 [Sycon ciliatum]|uniref:fibropellin-1-like isoform X2 n=1 Tax=Sycon ciliatum TaxID=27933 RepID=UPI0031F7152C